MILLFASDKNFGIGYQGHMLFHIPEDLSRFRRLTENNIVIMGRKTLESLPGSKPLPRRINIIVSQSQSYEAEDVYTVKNPSEVMDLLDQVNPGKRKKEFLIGGGSLVEDMIGQCDYAYITVFDRTYEKVDTWIPNLDKSQEWALVKESEKYPYEDSFYTYRDYKRIK